MASSVFAKRHGLVDVVLSCLTAISPEFLPDTGLCYLLFYLDVLLVGVMYTAPFYNSIESLNDQYGGSGTFANFLWTERFSFIPIITAVTCSITWAFGYITPDRWASRPSYQFTLMTTHVAIASARPFIGLIFMVLLFYDGRLTLMVDWRPYGLLFGWTLGIFLISFVQLALAIVRLATFKRDKRPIFRRFGYVVRGPEFDSTTNLAMKLDSPAKRRARQTEAQGLIARKTDVTRSNSVWHQPKNLIDTEDESFWEKMYSPWRIVVSQVFGSPSSHNVKKQNEDHDRGPLFARCLCCLEPLPEARSLEPLSWLNFQYSEWASLRNRYLRLPSRSDRNLGTFEGIDLHEDASPEQQLNKLCSKCDVLCGRSTLLDFMGGFSLRRVAKYIRHALSPFPLTEELFEHWSTFPELLAEATNGCHLCNLMLATLSIDQQDELISRDARLERELDALGDEIAPRGQAIAADRRIYVKIAGPSALGSNKDPKHAHSSLLLIPHFGYATLPRRWIRQRNVERAHSLNKDPGMEWHHEYVDPIEIRMTDFQSSGPICLSVEDSTGSDGSLKNLILPWLGRHVHSRRNPHVARALPGRLLDLSSNLDNGNTVHVVNTFGLQSSIRYAALSYCWRPDETNTLTATSGERVAVSISSLAPTIQNAISVSRRSGMRYLWVDALCIQQDCEFDRTMEFAKMSDIYWHADFVISAVAAADSSETFFVAQNPLAVNPCLLGAQDYRTRTRVLPGLFRGIYALPASKYAKDASEDIELSRLASRGWVLQEERLPSRIVSFTENQIILQCHVCSTWVKTLDWESVVNWSQHPYYDLMRPDIVLACFKLLRTLIWHRVWKWRDSLLESSQPSTEQDLDPRFASCMSNIQVASEKWTDMWYRLVEAYTLRYLSDQADRLQAIQGLADRLEREMMSQEGFGKMYFQGLFDSPITLVPSLLWYVSNARASRPSSRGPSWSWASVDGSIRNNSTLASPGSERCLVERILGPTQTGGHVRLKGKVRLAKWRRTRPGEHQEYYVGHRDTVDLDDPHYHQQFVPVRANPTEGPEAYALCDSTERKIGYFVPDTDEDLPSSGVDDQDGDPAVRYPSRVRQIYCLQIVVRPQSFEAEQDFSIPWAVRGLALIRCAPDEDVYRRVGYIELSRDHPGMEFFYTSPNKRRNRRERPYPVVDPRGFFIDCAESTISII